MKKRIVVLGASGSVGSQTVDVLIQHQDIFEVVALAVGSRVYFLEQYLEKYPLEYGCVQYYEDYLRIKDKYPKTKFFYGDDGLIALTSLEKIDIVCNCLQGFVGLLPTLNAIAHKCDIAISNKESLVAAGNIVMEKAKLNNVNLIPVDSEHSAIFQTILGNAKKDIKKLIITASGGAFRNLNREQLKKVTKEDALRHPRWNMGAKITIDSATMMNKGFEVIEAHVLFDIPYQQIDVIMHPESIVHSMTEYSDKSIIAQLGVTDMRLPIQYALTYPRRIFNNSENLSLAELGTLTFKNMNYERFPLLDLAYAVGYLGGNMPAILNGSNEMAVELFLKGKISFLDIEMINFEVVRQAKDIYIENPTLEQIIESNDWAVKKVKEILSK
ncbi:MAG: 1-deoxy-D-xylulose-5-phosphate reductoisomerase [Erysipelotrichaceae bacterium]|jgi:1-deoxy-D-xylulose-5-phosphate reductoisomerase